MVRRNVVPGWAERGSSLLETLFLPGMWFPSGTWFRGGEGKAIAYRVALWCGRCVDDDQAAKGQVVDGVPDCALTYSAFVRESSLAWITDSGFIGAVSEAKQNQFGHGWDSSKCCCPIGGLVTHPSSRGLDRSAHVEAGVVGLVLHLRRRSRLSRKASVLRIGPRVRRQRRARGSQFAGSQSNQLPGLGRRFTGPPR